MNNIASFAVWKSTCETFEIPQPAGMPNVLRIVNIETLIQINQGGKNA